MDIFYEIEKLIKFGIKYEYINEEDKILITNQVLEILELEEYRDFYVEEVEKLEKELEDTEYPCEILDNIVGWCIKNGKLKYESLTFQDLLNSKIMGRIIPRSSEIIKKFYKLFDKSSESSTDYYYKLSMQSNYIRTDRIKKDIRWMHNSDYGNLDITINFSKPEKDPKEIALAKNIPSGSYPLCLLCKENEGYAGGFKHPGRQNHRIIPLELKDEKWFLQYSPYIYYNEHCIVLSEEHRPMKIDKNCFERLIDFVELFPHYFIGSNADLPIVGGSILSHDHFQGGRHVLPMERAQTESEIKFEKFPEIKAGIVKWPLSVIRLSGKKQDIIDLGSLILEKWCSYSDSENEIISHTGEERHNTITPIARYRDGNMEMDLVLRNNRTTAEYPFGIFHPHKEYHNIKKENIGLIEVMGLAVLPGRLSEEMGIIKKYIFEKDFEKFIKNDKNVKKHYEWIKALINANGILNSENIDKIINETIGETFVKVLEDCGVFKRDVKGRKGFEKFIKYVKSDE